MTAALKNEIAALSFLLRGLSLRKTQTDALQRCISSVCLQHKCRRVPTVVFTSLTFSHQTPQQGQGQGQAHGHAQLGQGQAQRFTTTTSTYVTSTIQSSGVCNAAYPAVLFCQTRKYAKTFTTPKKPLSFDYSGDLVTQKPLNPRDIQADFRQNSQLENAPASVQKLFTLDFASGFEKKIHRKEDMRERILQLFGQGADREMQVAMLTVDIRNMIHHCLTDKKDKLSKSRLVEKIQMRKKILKILRRTDYQRFLWLLQELRIRYVLPPDYYRQVTKRFRRKQRVWEAANNLRLKKIAELKEQLEAEKADFLRSKEETLNEIQADAAKYGFDLEEFAKKLERKRIGKTYPYIYTWEERQKMENDSGMK